MRSGREGVRLDGSTGVAEKYPVVMHIPGILVQIQGKSPSHEKTEPAALSAHVHRVLCCLGESGESPLPMSSRGKVVKDLLRHFLYCRDGRRSNSHAFIREGKMRKPDISACVAREGLPV